MKYWAYLNDEVSQTSYTEEELKQLPGFSSDLLICSEASAVSSEPDWRPVRELLPHLIRPKAPDFSKFRPKPPVPGVQNNSNVLPIPSSLPVGVNSTPAEKISQTHGIDANSANAELLAQIKSLTEKISRLEGKVNEDHAPISLSDQGYSVDVDGEETFVSEPENDGENDVLEVPFDNDFEVPFDANKSSEEIAKEAEAMLNKPISTEIEEFDADDQHSELLNYSSDMQKILEDTIRKTNVFKQKDDQSNEDENGETKSNERVFIAEDLISKTTLSFTDKVGNESKPNKDIDKILEGEDNSQSDASQDISDNDEGKTIQDAIERDYPVVEAEKQPEEELSQENTPDETAKDSVENEEKSQEEVIPEVEAEEPEKTDDQVKTEEPEEIKAEESEEIKQEESEQLEDQVEAEKPQLASLDDIPQDIKEEVHEEISTDDKKEEYPAIDTLDDANISGPVIIPIEDTEDNEQKQEPQEADVKQDSLNNEESTKENESNEDSEEEESVEKEDSLEENFKEEKEEEKTANLSMTKGVTISKDATTAAVLDEIAMEKEAQSTKPESTVNKLFEELENTYKEEKDNNSVDSLEVNTETLESPAQTGEIAEGEELKEDEFLKTFTTSVEEVFLDQPTAIISDYVPPSEDGTEHGKPAFADNGIKREKPSDIKTVPLVPEALGQEIWSSPYVESATTKLGKGSVLANLIKWIVFIAGLTAAAVAVLSALAFFGIINEKFSPIHTAIYSLQKSRLEKTPVVDEDFSPEIVQESSQEEQNYQEEQDPSAYVIDSVKNYTFGDGSTLQSRIQSMHQNLNGEIEWSSFPTEEQNIYSIAVKIPASTEGQGFSYLFNYDLAGNILTPTTSLAKNIMEG